MERILGGKDASARFLLPLCIKLKIFRTASESRYLRWEVGIQEPSCEFVAILFGSLKYEGAKGRVGVGILGAVSTAV